MNSTRSARGFGLLQLVIVVVVMLVVTMLVLKSFQRSTSNLPASAGGGHPARSVLSREEIRVEGLASDADALQVTAALRGVPGVAGANTDFPTGMASVTFDPKQTNRRQLVAAIERAGFHAAP